MSIAYKRTPQARKNVISPKRGKNRGFMITIKNQKKKGKSLAFIKHEIEFSKKKLITGPQKYHLKIQSPRPTNKIKKRPTSNL
jgi:hypothetical protein